MHHDWQARMNDAPRPFNLVLQNFQEIGVLSLHRYLSSSGSELRVSTNHAQPTPETTALPAAETDALSAAISPVERPNPIPDPAVKMHHAARLHQACQRAFGVGEALKIDFLEENGHKSKQCIITITRPNGSVRSYQTEPIFSRKNDAKAEAAKIAIDMGALEFIQMGDLVMEAKNDPLPSSPDNVDPGNDGLVKEIEDSCIRWRAGDVAPQWFFYRDPKGAGYGAALRILLSMHAFRVYSSDTTYSSHSEAKAACAKTAVDEGVLDYLKRGNGHSPPSEPVHDSHVKISGVPVTAGPISLQAFYESLPRPFPELVSDKTALEINGPAWLNTTIQAARGGRLKANFFWMTDSSAGLHGCLLRLERPGTCKSYLVDTRLYKRADAKAAVCLLAMSQGVGNYIREVGVSVQMAPSHHLKQIANQYIYPQLASECEKIRPGNRPTFTPNTDRDAFGCTLEVDLSPSLEQPDMREYKVEPEYRTKADAKVAVACLAAEQGLFELLRFRGQPPPAGYKKFWDLHRGPSVIVPSKRKEHEDQDSIASSVKSKKQRGDATDSQEVSNANSKDKRKGSRKQLRASGSSGLVGLGSASQTGGSIDSNHYGNRSVGNSMALYGGPHFFGMAGPSAPFSPSYAPPPTNGWPSNRSDPYGFYPHSVPNAFQQRNPAFPGQFAAGAAYPAPPHNPLFSNKFPGQGVMPSPDPYGSYPQNPIGHPPFPPLENSGYIPSHPPFPPQTVSLPEHTSSPRCSVGDNVDPKSDLEKHLS